MNRIINYAAAFKKQFGTKLVLARVKDINIDITLSNYLPTRSLRTDIWYDQLARPTKKITEVLTLLEGLQKKSERKEKLEISHVDSDILYFAEV